jgi:hypothetical protein
MPHCVSERDILGPTELSGGTGGNGSGGGAGNAGSTSTAGTPAQGGQGPATTCYEALARGSNGDACKGPFNCSSVPRNCCHTEVSCGGANTLTISEVCNDCSCSVDSNCPSTFWCTDGRCRRCSQPSSGSLCPLGLYPFPRNGCTWCVPGNECGGPPGSPTCSSDQTCYAGQTCLPHCTDPGCCFGNVCDAPGCGPTTGLDCSIVGCPDGSSCMLIDPGQVCTCQSGRWLCSTASRNKCG